jgi:hypothetical protein
MADGQNHAYTSRGAHIVEDTQDIMAQKKIDEQIRHEKRFGELF